MKLSKKIQGEACCQDEVLVDWSSYKADVYSVKWICTEVDEVNESLRTDVCMKREDIR